MKGRPTSDPTPRLVATPFGTVGLTGEGDPAAWPVLCLHGLPGSSRDFRYLGPLLAPFFRVLRVEMPGFGAAPPGAVHTVRAWSRILRELCAASAVPPILLAHSFGGSAAILAAAGTAPVSGLVLVASMGARRHRAFSRPPFVWGVLAAMLHFPPARRAILAAAGKAYRQRRLPPPAHWRDLLLHLRLMASVDFGTLGRAARRVHVPVLILHAEDDPLIETAIPRRLAALMPDADLEIFPGGGHHLQKTRAPEIADAVVRRFADRCRVRSETA